MNRPYSSVIERTWAIFAIAFSCCSPFAQSTEYHLLAPDGAWCWFGNPRAILKDGQVYFGYVRYADGRVCLNAFDPMGATSQLLWASEMAEKDDHDNPGLCQLNDGRMLAIYAKHGGEKCFYYRVTDGPDTARPESWSPELRFTNTSAGVTYANPYQLAGETNRIINFMRNLNFNPTFTISDTSATNWSAPRILIKTGTGGYRPYVQYCSDHEGRVDMTYTDGHPDVLAVPTSLYHIYYAAGALWKSEGAFLKYLTNAPLLHDAPDLERGTVIYQYSEAPASDPNEHIRYGRAWSWDVAYHSPQRPVTVFSVQVTNVMGSNWYDDRIYYYYARWTGSDWQKRFIAHAGRPLYNTQRHYAGGISIDPNNPNVVYFSSNAADPFDLASTDVVPLRSNDLYEIFRGQTTDGGLTFTWQPVTINSTVDNLRPCVPRNNTFPYGVLWYAGTYVSYTQWDTAVYGIFSSSLSPVTVVPNAAPAVSIVSPSVSPLHLPNASNHLHLQAAVTDDGDPQKLTVTWSTRGGPDTAVFANPNASNTTVRFPQSGIYDLALTASDSLETNSRILTVIAGNTPILADDPALSLWLKLDEVSGTVAGDSSSSGYSGAVIGNAGWTPGGGKRAGAISLNGANAFINVPDASGLDNVAAMTIAFWVRPNAYTTGGAGLVSKRNAINDNNAYTTFLQTDGLVNVDWDGNNNRYTSVTPLLPGNWYHVAAIFDGTLSTNQRAKIFVNGALERVAPETSPAIPNYSSSLKVGLTHSNVTTFLNGMIDDVRVYRRALSGQEVAALAAAGMAPAVSVLPVTAATNRTSVVLNGAVTDDGQQGKLTSEWSTISAPEVPQFSSPQAAVTQVLVASAGQHQLMLAARNSVAAVHSLVNFTVWPNPSWFPDWIAAAYPGVTDPAVISPAADPDGDAMANLAEFALGLDPVRAQRQPFTSVSAGLPVGSVQVVDGSPLLVLSVRRPKNLLGVSYLVEVSSSLENWTDAELAIAFGEPIDNGDGTEMVRFRTASPTQASGTQFIRLRIAEVGS